MTITWNVKRQPEEKKVPIPIWGCAEYNEKLYFSAWSMNALCTFDFQSGKVCFCRRFDNENAECFLHTYAVVYRNEIWFVPDRGSFISVLNVDTMEIESVELPGEVCADSKFCAVILENQQYLWLIPWKYNHMLRINMDTKTFCKIEDNPIQHVKKAKEGFFVDAVKIENDIWMFPHESDAIYVYDTIKKKTKKQPWTYGNRVVNKMVYAEGAIWFLPTKRSSYLIKRELLTGSETYYELPEEQTDHMEWDRFFVADCIDNWLWIAPFEGRNFIRVDIHTGEIEEITELHRKACLMKNPSERFQIIYKTEKYLLFMSDAEEVAMFMYQKDSGEVTFYELSISSEEYAKYMASREKQGIIDERIMDYKDFMNVIVHRNTVDKNIISYERKETTGRKIWDGIK